MKATAVLSLTGLGIKELPKLLHEMGVKTSWQAVSAQHNRFRAGEAVDDLLTIEQAEQLLKLLESPQTDLQSMAAMTFNEVAPLFRGVVREASTPVNALPEAVVSNDGDWVSGLFDLEGQAVRYNRSSFEGEDAGVVQIEV